MTAPRKPTKSRRNEPNKNLGDLLGGAADLLGGAAKGVQSWSESQARTFTNPYINAAGRVIGKNPNLPVSGAKEAITNTAFGVVDVASGPIGRVVVKGALATGYVAGKAIQTAAGAVKSGRVVNPAAAVHNFVKGEKVIVVGTKSDDVLVGKNKFGDELYKPNPLSKGDVLSTVPGVVKPPQTVYAKLKDKPVRWGFDPSKARSMRELTESVSDYTDRWYHQSNLVRKNDRLEFGGWTTPEIAITRVPKFALSTEPIMPNYPMTDAQDKAVKAIIRGVGSLDNPVFRSGAVASTSPAKIVSTVSPVLPNPYSYGAKYGAKKTADVLEKELAKAIKRAGGKVPKRR